MPSHMNHFLEDRNYHNDRRVRAAEEDDGLVRDEKAMTLTWMREVETESGEVEEVNIVFPGRFEVCDLCDGRGAHVNPSIDAGGISSEDRDFWNDVDEETGESRYFRGDYDVPCYRCHGKRVVLVIDEENCDETCLREYHAAEDDRAEFDAVSRAERAMGA